MTEVKFQWQSFDMEKSAKDFFEKYISRIDKYAKSHHISDDVLDDIHQSILEKLFEIKWEVTQKKLVKIVNSIWEPEDIFEEDSEIQVSKENKKPEPKYRPRILGVCAWLAELMRIPVRVLRLIFFLLIFTYSFWIWLYLVIFLIRFVTDRELASASISDWVKRIVPRLWDLVRWLWKNGLALIKRLFFLPLSLWLLCVVICLWIFFYYLVSGLAIWNIDYSTLFPGITKYWVVLWMISAFILFLASVWVLFKKHFSNNTSIIAAIWCWVFAVIIAIISLLWVRESIWNVTWTNGQEVVKNLEVEAPNNWEILNLLVRTSEFYTPKRFLNINEPRFVNLFASENGKIKVVYTFEFKDVNWEYVSQAIENISDIEYNREWDNFLVVWLKGNEIFDKLTPAVPLRISIDIYVPKDLEIKLHNVWYMTDPLTLPEWAKEYWTHGYHDCNIIKFNKETESFYCEISMNSNDKYDIAKINLKKMADNISPLKWLHPSWSQSSTDQYWVLDSINITDEDKLLAKLSDQFFNFFILIEYTIDEETWEFTLISSKLKNMEQKWFMDEERMTYYEWRENLTGFKIQMKEEE